MPHATLKLRPGVDQNRTLTLNEAAISECNLIRFIPDKEGLGLVQKLGGWTSYYNPGHGFNIPIRALLAWQDTNTIDYLGVGCQTTSYSISSIVGNGTTVVATFSGTHTFYVGEQIFISGTTISAYNGFQTVTASTENTFSFSNTTAGSQLTAAGIVKSASALNVVSKFGGVSLNSKAITPQTTEFNVAVTVATTAGSNRVKIGITGSAIQTGDTLYIKTQISVGGLILFGKYETELFDANNCNIYATDVLGNPQNATTTSTSGAVPIFSWTISKNEITVVLANHGYFPGDTFPILVPFDVSSTAGFLLYGNYIITALDSVDPINKFKIVAANLAQTTSSASENAGNARYVLTQSSSVSSTYAGYGAGNYGDGGYGIGAVVTTGNTGTPVSSTDWTLDNWGEYLISCPIGGDIYFWNPNSGESRAGSISAAPPVNDGIFVAMPQRQIIAWGSTFTGIVDPLLIRWCDVQNFDVWAPTITNQAGSYRIPKGSKIVGCIQGPQQGLVWTDLAIWAMQYVGPDYIYQFNEIGNGCGLIGRKAAASMNGIVYWMSQSQFFRLTGTGVEIISCPVWDVIFQDLDTTNLDKIRIAPNSRFGEIAWHYPTVSGGGELTAYVKHNVFLGTWDFGQNTDVTPYVSRTAWINQSVLGPPIGAGTDTYLYQHETSQSADSTIMDSYFQTGYFALQEGEFKTFVDQIWPDMKWGFYDGAQNAKLQVTFYVADYPGGHVEIYGPYKMDSTTDYITSRFRGRLVSFRIERDASSDVVNDFWRIGATRYRFQPDGKF